MKFTFGLLLASFLLLKNTEASIPDCSDCSVFTTGKDGSLWGWENDSFCKIPTSCSNNRESNKSNSATKSRDENNNDNSKAANSSASGEKNDANGNVICKGCVVTGTGGENSLWGWEDNASCIIDKIKCEGKLEEKNESTDGSSGTKDKVICNECVVTATGGDGSLWGWENQASCAIDKAKCNLEDKKSGEKTLERGPDGVLICSTCEYTRIDPDTSTWNTENGEDCRVIGSRCGINTTPHPWCNGCDVTGTGGDGSLYGWENNNSCLINEISCKFSENQENDTNVSSASIIKITSLYYIMASLTVIYFIGAF